jgi:hypothetical protein
MRYLIDGYNLLHALGVLQGRAGPGGLEKARTRLLGMLRGKFGDHAHDVTVVFDAAQAPPGAVEVQDHHGIQVRFAVAAGQADDVIEEFIRKESSPGRLTVVSDDRRLQQAAKRRRCPVLDCGTFIDLLLRPRRPAREAPLKPDQPREDREHWLKEFADLEADPNFKELFEPFDFT